MEDAIQVEAARIPDRDRLVELLEQEGLHPRRIDEVGIEVPVEEDGGDTESDVFGQVERLILDIGAPFVPIQHEGVIYIRPPLS
jgi:hypothetical protein